MNIVTHKDTILTRTAARVQISHQIKIFIPTFIEMPSTEYSKILYNNIQHESSSIIFNFYCAMNKLFPRKSRMYHKITYF